MTGGQPTEMTSNAEHELQYYYLFFMLLFLSPISCNVLNYTFPVMGRSNANFCIEYLDKITLLCVPCILILMCSPFGDKGQFT